MSKQKRISAAEVKKLADEIKNVLSHASKWGYALSCGGYKLLDELVQGFEALEHQVASLQDDNKQLIDQINKR